MKTLKIFLASSEELAEDRRAFELMINQLNKDWVPNGVFFNLVVWEDFVDALSKEGLQREYNAAVRDCDLFVLLFFTKVGRFTGAEFEAAFGAFQAGNRPLIYTYFKDDLVLTGNIDESVVSLLEFKARLRQLNHYVTRYRGVEDLKWQFSRQLDKLFTAEPGRLLAQSLAMKFTDSTPRWQLDAVALALADRYLTDRDGPAEVDLAQLRAALAGAGELARGAIWEMAYRVRSDNWRNDKRTMERAIPILRALVEADAGGHHYVGQLGYALKDQTQPDWKAARDCLDKAITLRGAQGGGNYYEANRALANIMLDEAFAAGKPSDAALRKSIVQDLRDSPADIAPMLEEAGSAIKRWLQLNGSPRL